MGMSDDLLCEVCGLPLSDHTVAMAEECIAFDEDREAGVAWADREIR